MGNGVLLLGAGLAALMFMGDKKASASAANGGTKKKWADMPRYDAKAFNAATARATAPVVVAHLIEKGYNYDRKILQEWQGYAGLRGDGIYGPQTATALRYYGAANAPKALFKGSVSTYQPPVLDA